jgi:hypothetical protein
MTQGRRAGHSAAQRTNMWSRWKAGQSLHQIGRAVNTSDAEAFSRCPRVCQNLHLFLFQFVESSRLLTVLCKRDESRRWRFRKSGKGSSREQSDDHREKEPGRQNHKYVDEQLPSYVSVPMEASLGIVGAETGGGNVPGVPLWKDFCTHQPQQQSARRTQVPRSPIIKLSANRV